MMRSDMKPCITFISAGAGSGKTHRLTELLHQELSTGNVRPSGVIATTFTRKAATELRERAREHLLEKGQFGLANAMGQARIGTVNSVCGQLIERFAFEAGVSTEQQVLDEVQAGILLGRAIDTVLDGKTMSEFLRIVRRLGLETDREDEYKDSWRDHLQTLVDQIRSNDIPLSRIKDFATNNADDLLSHFPRRTDQALDADLLAAIQSVLPTIEAAFQKGNTQVTKSYLDLIKGIARSLESGSTAWSEWVKLSKQAPESSLRAVVEPVASLAGRFAEHPGLHADIRDYLTAMFELAAKALERYQIIKQELGALDFADQEHQLLGLLDHPHVAAVLKGELDLLMVDEFQDTSPIQLALFLKLAGFAKRVYWVGDIKQAIYGFRGSDTELMQAILSALPSLDAVKEVLPSSWRSRPELVKSTNAVFCHAFADSLPKDEVVLKPERKDPLSGPALANWFLEGTNVEQDAIALASGLRQLIESGYTIYDKSAKVTRAVRYGDIAILCRSNDGVKGVAAALSGRGIPAATAQPGLLVTPEATLALACLRRLNDPGDTVATAEIVSLSDALDPEDWVADRLRYLAHGGEKDMWLEQTLVGFPAHPLLERIAELRLAMPLLAPAEALATVMAACVVPEKVVRWTPEPDRVRVRLANLEALVELAEQYEDLCRSGQRAASVSGLILWLGEIAAQKKDMLAEPSIDAVKIMTHHAAKGLEWPVVVLMDLTKNIKDRLWSISAQSNEVFNAYDPLANRVIRFWPWPFGKQKKFDLADAISRTSAAQAFRKSAIDEAKRLLYVSMTRARDLLVLARPQRRPRGEWIDCLEAPWLLAQEGAKEVVLPTGERVEAQRWVLSPEDTGGSRRPKMGNLHWFQQAVRSEHLPPLNFTPSASESTAAVLVEKCRIGERIPVVIDADMGALGTAIHACIALSFTDRRVPLEEAEVGRILTNLGVSALVSPVAVLRQIKALHAWLEQRWPGAKPFAELPVQSTLRNGQILNGRIDLALETDKGWVLIDHKSSPLAWEQWDRLVIEYAAQIDAYAQALEQGGARRVLEKWLFLPVAAGGVRIG